MNVIGIVLDTLRSDIIGPDQKLGFVQTPRLDALEAESVVFRNAFGEGQPTLQCRRSFYTGRRTFPWVHNYDRRGHWHHAPGWHKIPPEHDTIAEILLERGYRTGLVSDVYHMFKPTMNYWRGFLSYDFIRGQESDNWVSGPFESVCEQAARHSLTPEPIPQNALLYQYLLNQRFRKSEEDYQCARVFRSAADWLDDNAGGDSPFFLWVEAFDPHEPWEPPTAYADRYCPNTTGIDYIIPRLPQNPSAGDIERTKALYYGEVSFLDRWIGHLLDKVDALNLWEDTIVLVLSDHGTQVWDHGQFGKGGGNLRRYNTGIVWQMRIPGLAAARLLPIVQAHDVMPTLLELLDVPYARCDGQSVMPLVRGDTDQLREKSVMGWAGPANGNAGAFASVRTPEWNYCTPTHALGQDVLYDLANDPDENVDVKAEHPELVKEFQREIEGLVGQPLPAKLNEVCDPETFPMLKYMRRLAEKR